MSALEPKYEELQSIYDISNECFDVTRVHEIGPHYVRTLQLWAAALQAHHDEAVAVQSQQVYERYDKYLNGCVKLFRDGYTSVHQYTLQK